MDKKVIYAALNIGWHAALSNSVLADKKYMYPIYEVYLSKSLICICVAFTNISNVLTMNVTFCLLSKWSSLIYSSVLCHRWVCITLILTWLVGLCKDLSSLQRMQDKRPEMSDDDGRGRLRASLTRTGWALLSCFTFFSFCLFDGHLCCLHAKTKTRTTFE